MSNVKLLIPLVVMLLCACGKSAEQQAAEQAKWKKIEADAAAAAQAEIDADQAKRRNITEHPAKVESHGGGGSESGGGGSGSMGKIERDSNNPKLSQEFRKSMIALYIAMARHVRNATTSESNACFEKYRGDLLDPRNAYLVSSGVYDLDGDTFVAVDVSARTRGGGADRIHFVCTLQR